MKTYKFPTENQFIEHAADAPVTIKRLRRLAKEASSQYMVRRHKNWSGTRLDYFSVENPNPEYRNKYGERCTSCWVELTPWGVREAGGGYSGGKRWEFSLSGIEQAFRHIEQEQRSA